ncbi:cytochrome P450 [Auricularia subglabra TFB-10046 SS5]|nr:cytochrome P450 [Auricularia subglabra TFB-10046 SS5]
MPATNQWEGLTDMGKKYGPVVHLRVLHKRIIILNSLEAVTELLDRRGSVYSDRPVMTMVCELMGWDWATSLMRYGERWRANRRVVHYFFHERASKRYHSLQTRTNLEFLLALLDAPRGFMHHIHSLTAATIMKLTYDIDIDINAGGADNPWVALARDAVETMTSAAVFGTFAVDWMPIRTSSLDSLAAGADYVRSEARPGLVSGSGLQEARA